MDGLTLSLVTAASTLAGWWGILAVNRVAELRKCTSTTETSVEQLPSVTVIMPCHGIYNYARICERWNSQLTTTYFGSVSFVYVVESVDDPAFMTICKYLSQVHGLEEAGKAGISQNASYLERDIVLEVSPHRSVRLVVSGMTTRSTQKIHSILCALSGCTTEFVAFLDDDIKVHKGILSSLVSSLLVNQHAMISTGYSVEVPVAMGTKSQKEPSALANHIIMVYRMINMISFTFTQVPFCWGGCFCLRRQDIYEGSPSPYTAWVDGGYSEDTTISHIAHRQGRSIISPRDAILVHDLYTSNKSILSCMSYLCRQIFVLKTHHTHQEGVINKLLLIIALCTFLCIDLMILLAVKRGICCILKLTLLGMLRLLVSFRGMGFIDELYSVLFHVRDKLGLSTELGMIMYKSQLLQVNTLVVTLTLLAIVHNTCFSLLVRIWNMKSPEKLPTTPNIRIGTTATALVLYCLIMPILIIGTIVRQQICWGSHIYTCERGRVVSIKSASAALRIGKKMELKGLVAIDKVPMVKERVQVNKKSLE